MKRKLKNIALAIIVFYPTENELDRIYYYLETFDNVFVYCNSPFDLNLSRHIVFKSEKIIKFGNGNNDGLSKAYNVMINCCSKKNIKYLLILDQDSIYPLQSNSSLYFLEDNNPPNDAALITSRKIPKSLKNKYKFKLSNQFRKRDFKKVKNAINSGSILDINKIIKIGGYDNDFFVDKVDFDVCRTIKQNNLNLYQMYDFYIFHDVGFPKTKKFGNIKISFSVYNPSRIYLIAKSRLIFNKKWIIKNSNKILVVKITLFYLITIAQILKHSFFIILNNENIFSSIYNLIKGSIEGFLYSSNNDK